MGHIINAKSTRLGWTYNWCDIWFVDSLYYPEFLHAIIKMRYFLVHFFFFNPFWDKYSFFYSHFELHRYSTTIYVRLFLYDGFTETFIEKFFFKYYLAIKAANEEDPNKYKSKHYYEYWKWLSLYWVFSQFSNETFVTKQKLILLSKAFKKLNIKYFRYFVTQNDDLVRNNLRKRLIPEMMFLFALTRTTKLNHEIENPTDVYIVDTLLRRWIISGLGSWYTYEYYDLIGRVISYIFFCFTKFFKVHVHFYLIANQHVTAKFLARFMARKLKQNYPVNFLINPIMKELNVVWNERRMTSKYAKLNCVETGALVNSLNTKKFTKLLFTKLLITLFTLYFKRYYIFFIKYKTWFSIDMLYTYIWFNNQKEKLNIIGWSSNYFLKKPAFVCFFSRYYRVLKTANSLATLYIPFITCRSLLNNMSNYIKFFDIFNDELFVSSHSVFYFNESKYYFDLTQIRYAGAFLNEYLKYNYWYFNYQHLRNPLLNNNLRDRFKTKIKRPTIIAGFKFHLSGRFTRRQRAKSVWHSYGRVPLNSISEKIEYDFVSIPIRNSTITVKVWLNRSSTYEAWDFKWNFF